MSIRAHRRPVDANADDLAVAVGSTNPVKVAAVERVLPGADVAPVAVDSGVADQPRGIDETIAGAETRARRAHAGDDRDRDLGIGLEGGVADDGTDDLYLVMWAAATDGDRIERGGGPSLRLPDPVARRVRSGAELGPVVDDLEGREGTKRAEGAVGVFTGGRTDRTTALATAVAAALGPLLTDHYGPD